MYFGSVHPKDDSFEFLRLLHRDEARCINFAENNGTFRPLGSIRIGELIESWPKIRPYLHTDGYFS